MHDDPGLTFEIALFVVVVIAAIGAGVFVIINGQRRFRRRQEHDLEFVQMLVRAARNNALAEPSDVFTFYGAHYDPGKLGLRDYAFAQHLLERAIMSLASSVPTADENVASLVETLKKLRDQVAAVVEKEEKKVPFHGTPERERQLLEDILELTNADRNLVYTKLARLGELVAARQQTITALGEEKGKAKKLAWWGLVGTIFFGVVSVVATIIAAT